MISGYGPSGPFGRSGGNATVTSIGTPSNVFTVLRGAPTAAWLQRRTPFGWTAQGTGVAVFVNALVIVAPAGEATDSTRQADANAMPSLTTERSVTPKR